MTVARRRDDNWIDGLRGIASFIVVTGHLCTAFSPTLHSPAEGSDRGPRFFQLPIFRLCVGGRGAVALFFLITGFVNSLNPLKHFANDNQSVALPNLAKASFTRFGRLILPTNAAAFVAWFICQLGGFNMARSVESAWIRGVSVAPGPTAWKAIKALFHNMTYFWHDGSGMYDPTHWAIVYFLKGSMTIYLTLLATSLVKTRWRLFIIVLLYSFCWWTDDNITGINIYSGLFLAQIQVILGNRATSFLPRPVPSIFIVTGLLITSYPQINADWMPWSRVMRVAMAAIVPKPDNDKISRYWVSVGISVLVFGIFTSRNARRILSLPLFNFLGRVSFGVYLIHNTLIRTIMVWMVYGGNAAKTDVKARNEKGEQVNYIPAVGAGWFMVSIPVFYAVLYALAHLWTKYVDCLCADAVVWVRTLMFKKIEETAVAMTEKKSEPQPQPQSQPTTPEDAPLLPITNQDIGSASS